MCLFWIPYSFLHGGLSIYACIPLCHNYCSFIIEVLVSDSESPPTQFFKISLGNPHPLHFHINFRISFSVSKKEKEMLTGILIGNVLLYKCFGSWRKKRPHLESGDKIRRNIVYSKNICSVSGFWPCPLWGVVMYRDIVVNKTQGNERPKSFSQETAWKVWRTQTTG